MVAATWLGLTTDEQLGPQPKRGSPGCTVTSGVLRELTAADLDDEKIDEVEDVYFDWTHRFMSATR